MTIPRFQSSPKVSLSAPRQANTSESGAKGRAIQNLGQAVRQVAGAGLQIANQLDEKRRIAEIQSFGDSRARELRMKVSEFEIQRRAERQGTDFRGHEEEVQTFLRQETDKILASSPGPESSDFFKKKVAAFSDAAVLSAKSNEFIGKAKFFKAQREEGVNEEAAFFNINPDTVKASAALERIKGEHLAAVGTQFGSKEEALQEFKNAQTKFRQAVFSGFIRDGLPSTIADSNADLETQTEQVKSFLQSEDNEILLGGMSAKESNQFITRALNSIKIRNKSKINELRSLTSNAVNELIKGTVSNPRIQSQIDSVFGRIQAMPDSDIRTRLISDIMNAKIVGEKTEEFKFLSKEEILDTDIESLFPTLDLSESTSDSKVVKLLAARTGSILKERERDGRAYVDSVFSGLSDLESLKMQESMGISNTRVLTKNQSFQQAEAILSLPSARDRSLALEEFIVSRDSSISHKAIRELIEDNPNFGSEYLVASYLSSQQGKENVIRNGSKQSKRDINDIFKGQGQSSELLKTKVTKRLKEDLQILSQSELGFLGSSLLEAVSMESKRLVNQGDSIDTAVLKAKKLIIDDNFEFYQDNNVKAIVPKSIPLSVDQLEFFSDISLDESFLVKMGATSKRFARAISEEDFIDLVSEEAVWVTSDDSTGLELKMANRETGQLLTLSNAEGSKIFIKFGDIPEINSRSDISEITPKESLIDIFMREGEDFKDRVQRTKIKFRGLVDEERLRRQNINPEAFSDFLEETQDLLLRKKLNFEETVSFIKNRFKREILEEQTRRDNLSETPFSDFLDIFTDDFIRDNFTIKGIKRQTKQFVKEIRGKIKK